MRKASFVLVPLCVISATVFSSLRPGPAQAAAGGKQAQCRSLFETVVDSRNMDHGFYARKANTIRSLPISDSKLQGLQSRFVSVFGQMANGGTSPAQANQLVGELSRYCFR
jgi:hypothetical protein